METSIPDNETEEQVPNSSTKRANLIVVLILMAMAIGFVWFGLQAYLKPGNKLSKLSFTKVSGVIVDRPEKDRNLVNKENYIKFRLKDYTKYDFIISRNAYTATDKDSLYRLNSGDSVFLSIETDDYQNKLLKEKALTLKDKYDRHNWIDVYELSDNQYQYLKLKNYKKATIEYDKKGIFLAAGGFGFLCLIIIGLYKMYKKEP